MVLYDLLSASHIIPESIFSWAWSLMKLKEPDRKTENHEYRSCYRKKNPENIRRCILWNRTENYTKYSLRIIKKKIITPENNEYSPPCHVPQTDLRRHKNNLSLKAATSQILTSRDVSSRWIRLALLINTKREGTSHSYYSVQTSNHKRQWKINGKTMSAQFTVSWWG